MTIYITYTYPYTVWPYILHIHIQREYISYIYSMIIYITHNTVWPYILHIHIQCDHITYTGRSYCAGTILFKINTHVRQSLYVFCYYFTLFWAVSYWLYICYRVESNVPSTTIHFPCLDQQRPLELVFSGVTVAVDKRPILRDVSGVVRPGELLAVMGPSGEWRSTVAHLVKKSAIFSVRIFIRQGCANLYPVSPEVDWPSWVLSCSGCEAVVSITMAALEHWDQ